MEDAKLTNFLSQIKKNNVVPKYKYLVTLDKIINPFNTREISLVAIEAIIPARILTTAEYRYSGPVRKQVYGTMNEDVTFTFLCTGVMEERKFFDSWCNQIYDRRYNMRYLDAYKSTIHVTQITKHDKRFREDVASTIDFGAVIPPFSTGGGTTAEDNYHIKLIDAYPITVEASGLAYASGTEFQTIQVRFTFRELEHPPDVDPGEIFNASQPEDTTADYLEWSDSLLYDT